MPTYQYQCKECGTAFEKITKIADRKVPETQPCPSCGKDGTVEQAYFQAPSLGDPVRLGLLKPDNGFKEVLQKVHERTPGSQLNQMSNLKSI